MFYANVLDFIPDRNQASAANAGRARIPCPDGRELEQSVDSGGSCIARFVVARRSLFLAYTRRYLIEILKTNKSTLAARSLEPMRQLYDIEREVKDLMVARRLEERRERATPIAKTLQAWLFVQRVKVVESGVPAGAVIGLKCWSALTRHLGDPALPLANNHDVREIRTWETRRKNWPLAGILITG